MKRSVLVGGEAGRGTDKTAALIGEIFSSCGYYCFIYRDYGSFIKGGHNFSVVTVSSDPVFSHEENFDVIVALDDVALRKHIKFLKPDGLIFVNNGDRKPTGNIISVGADEFAARKNIKRSFGNNVFIGAVLKSFGLDWHSGWKILSKQFSKFDAVVAREALKKGYGAWNDKRFWFKPRLQKLRLSTGNQAAARAAVESGLELCFAYPITPATGFVDELRQGNRVVVHQPEDEIAAINNSLGATFGGAMTAVATSGEGAALMAESFSLAAMSELPLVLYWAERLGPSTGVPTYTSQGDLKFALNIGHGEFPRVVVAPGDADEAYNRTAEAFYLAYKYRLPVVILTDKHLAESYYNFKPSPFLVRPEKFLTASGADYKSYAVTRNGVSPRLAPGQNQVVRVTSYEHDEEGLTTEDPKTIVAMDAKRWKKRKFLEGEIAKLQPYRVYGKGKNLIVGWGSVKGAIIDALRELPDYSFLQITYVAPFPVDKVKKIMRKARKTILVENNSTGLLGQVIKEKTGIEIGDKILKNGGRPFTADEIVKRLKAINRHE
ncbi:MAG: 2-oxoacid:acceptor oxidoreductase subunit alpha [Patescibacteria group bacterium]|nr:2-oxoacid:acceptor oxidoreductase subunit alpha [Patescibacteria group bacterium]MCL5261994.1 2-oxoacid:acceptor oxidoreductase subunit alpha [Patescibacteria group bacterium]